MFRPEPDDLRAALRSVSRAAYAVLDWRSCSEIPRSASPVSYTHLDVYKRQGSPWTCARPGKWFR